MNHASYNITTDKIKLYLDNRLSESDYKRAKGANFVWYPGQKCLCAKWYPASEDFALEFVAGIDEDDTPDNVEARVERFEKYADNAEQSAEYAASRLENATTERKARMAESTLKNESDQAVYWQRRIAGAIAHAAYKDRPDVIARRIKGLETDKRRCEKVVKQEEGFITYWSLSPMPLETAIKIANYDHVSACFPPEQYPASKYAGARSLWSALTENIITAEEAATIALKAHTDTLIREKRTLDHVNMRIEYEKAYLASVAGDDKAEELTAPKERRKSIAPDDGLKKGDMIEARIWFGSAGHTIVGPIISIGPRSVKVGLPPELDPRGFYAKGYQVARDRVKKATPKAE